MLLRWAVECSFRCKCVRGRVSSVPLFRCGSIVITCRKRHMNEISERNEQLGILIRAELLKDVASDWRFCWVYYAVLLPLLWKCHSFNLARCLRLVHSSCHILGAHCLCSACLGVCDEEIVWNRWNELNSMQFVCQDTRGMWWLMAILAHGAFVRFSTSYDRMVDVGSIAQTYMYSIHMRMA